MQDGSRGVKQQVHRMVCVSFIVVATRKFTEKNLTEDKTCVFSYDYEIDKNLFWQSTCLMSSRGSFEEYDAKIAVVASK